MFETDVREEITRVDRSAIIVLVAITNEHYLLGASLPQTRFQIALPDVPVRLRLVRAIRTVVLASQGNHVWRTSHSAAKIVFRQRGFRWADRPNDDAGEFPPNRGKRKGLEQALEAVQHGFRPALARPEAHV